MRCWPQPNSPERNHDSRLKIFALIINPLSTKLEIGDIEKVFGTLKVDAKYEPDKKR